MTDHVLFNRLGHAGIITLNRPKSLNALTYDMIKAISLQLLRWRDDADVALVVIKSAPGRAFCAGGDITEVTKRIDEEGIDATHLFFRHEYRLNWRIHHFPKPYMALIDGITMGGGCGLSVHGDFRVATERTTYAMPETGIGLFPDVGGSYFMPRCPGETGMYSALTGERLRPADAYYLGIANSYTPSDKLEALITALAESDISSKGNIENILQDFHESPGQSDVALLQGQIDVVFRENSVEEILETLKLNGSEWALKTHGTLMTKSPSSVKVTYRELREGAKADFDDCMRMEYRIVTRVMAGHDFYEGVRAVIVDKDNAPKWQPDTFEHVGEAEVDEYFVAPDEGDLHFDGPVGTRIGEKV